MVRLGPLCCVAEVPLAGPLHILCTWWLEALMITIVENQASNRASESILRLHTDEQNEFPSN